MGQSGSEAFEPVNNYYDLLGVSRDATEAEIRDRFRVIARDLHPDVRDAVDPQGRGRQYVSSHLERLTGTRIGGFVLTRQASAGKWGTATYALKSSGDGDGHLPVVGENSGSDQRDEQSPDRAAQRNHHPFDRVEPRLIKREIARFAFLREPRWKARLKCLS